VFRGYFLDENAHAALVIERVVDLQQLSPNPSRSAKIMWPEMVTTTFDHMNMLDLTSMDDLVYARPTFINFPSIDSFAVMPEKLFNENAKPNVMCLVMFQITGANTHKEVGNDLENVHDRVILLRKKEKELPVYLVFVTTKAGVREAQDILTIEGKVYDKKHIPNFVKRVKQFTLLLGKEFEGVASTWQEEEEEK
jgi:hypothetical protein